MFILLGDPPITIDPTVAKQPSLDIPGLCDRCNRDVFGPVTWAHLRGETLTPAIPEEHDANYHIVTDCEFVWKMFAPRDCPPNRGPIVDIEVSAQDIVQSSTESCLFCKILTGLDKDGSILSEPAEEKVVLSLQLLQSERNCGIYESALLEVGLHPDTSGGGEILRLALIDESGEY